MTVDDTRREPSPAEFEALTQAAYENLPDAFRAMCGDLVIQVPDWPQPDILAHFKIDTPYGLLGLYHGVSLDKKSVLDPPHGPDMVFLYRLPIMAYACERGLALRKVIINVLVHEIGHHFGLSDDDMDAIEASVAN